MSNPAELVDDSGARTKPGDRPRKRTIFLWYLFIGMASSVLTTTVVTLAWDRRERLAGSREEFNWSPIDDLGGMIMLAPVGWTIYSFLHVAGWIFWPGCIAATITGRRWLLILAALGGAIFGLFWPRHFVGMMGI